ncbi:MAG: hypothetical protein ACYTG3_06410 [Planctomycetota bacterium]|jgi:hypothetical protein
MRRPLSLICSVFFLAALLPAQEGDKRGGSGKYTNSELGLVFSGVYGWKREIAHGSGAWTRLARYSDTQLDSEVALYVRDNPYETFNELRRALETEFKAGEMLKDVSFTDVAMKRGTKLQGIQSEAIRIVLTKEGKKRERKVVCRTYFGQNRLFRVNCDARRSRAKRVRDLFDRALASLVVNATDERTVVGTQFRSLRGKYSLLVPEGFTAVLPASNRGPTDFLFEDHTQGVSVSIVSYSYDAILADLVEQMVDYYGDDLKMEQEEAKVMGGEGFLATLKKGTKLTLIVGTVQNDRAYRIHTKTTTDKLEEAKRAQAAFMEGFKAQR